MADQLAKEIAALLHQYEQALNSPEGYDDRTMIQPLFVAKIAELHLLDPNHPALPVFESAFVKNLWNQLPHPSPEWAHHCWPFYREADGKQGGFFPDIGRASSNYIMDVIPKNSTGRQSDGSPLPSATLIFDKLLKRVHFHEHPNGLSSTIFHLATLITHDLFNSDYLAGEKNLTTSYLDMSWLYGWNQAMQDSVRDKAGARGRLYPDVLADNRIILQPPGVVALGLLFCRNHNYIAEHLYTHNLNEPRFADIVDGINGLSKSEQLDEQTTIATGNQCSIEFNIIYRWHSTISENDNRWLEHVMQYIMGPDYTDPEKVIKKLMELRTKESHAKPYEKTYFYDAPRPQSPTGVILPYPDEVIAINLLSSIKATAGAWGKPNTPKVLEAMEILGIEQARKLGVCSLNEYRKFLKLKQFKTFAEINPEPSIAAALQELYKTVDDVELYAGAVAEEAMKEGRGAGHRPGYTIALAILSDAVALVRGDRYLSFEDSPRVLTEWGYKESRSQHPNTFYGTLVGEKLINRHLPNHFPANYIGTVLPFNTPAENKRSVPQADQHQFTFEDPFPIPTPPIKPKSTHHMIF